MISQRLRIPLVTIIAVVFLEIWSINSGRLINFDGILYLRSADAFANFDFSSAYAIYRWPLYSALIALGSQLFAISLTTSAYVINGLFQIILTLVFINLVKQLGGNRRCQWFALAILIAHPYLSDYRSYIIRDFGYWAFLLLGISSLATSATKQQIRYALLGSISLIISTAFRVEGLIFVLLLPISFLFIRQFAFSQRLKYLFFGWLPLILGIISVVVLAQIYADANLRSVGRMDHVLNLSYAIPTIRDNVTSIIADMKSSVLDYQAQHGASVIVIGGLLVLMLFEIIKVTNIFLFLMGAYAAKRHFVPKSFAKRLCKFTLYINLGILLYFVGTFNFLTGRYVIPISLIVLLWVPFTIEHMYQYFCVSQNNKLKYWYYPATMCILAGLLAYNLSHWRYDKTYIRDAGQWTQRHITDSQPLKSNNAEYLFYSRGIIKEWDQRFQTDTQDLLQQASIDDAVAVKLNKKQALKLLPTLHNWKFLATFQNKKGDRLIIMQKRTS